MDAETAKLVAVIAAAATLSAATTTAFAQFLVAWFNGRTQRTLAGDAELRARRASRVDPILKLANERVGEYWEMLRFPSWPDPSMSLAQRADNVEGRRSALSGMPLYRGNAWRGADFSVSSTVMIFDLCDGICDMAAQDWIVRARSQNTTSQELDAAYNALKDTWSISPVLSLTCRGLPTNMW
jgi:hypothetical protein